MQNVGVADRRTEESNNIRGASKHEIHIRIENNMSPDGQNYTVQPVPRSDNSIKQGSGSQTNHSNIQFSGKIQKS